MEITVKSLADLPSAARTLAPLLLRRGGVVALYGDMGAGKTTLTGALLREMGSRDDVSSPTFALVNEYTIPGSGSIYPDFNHTPDSGPASIRSVYHFDFYRIDNPSEAFDLGYEEYFYSGELCLVEWPEKIESLLPDDTLHIRITLLPDGARLIAVEE